MVVAVVAVVAALAAAMDADGRAPACAGWSNASVWSERRILLCRRRSWLDVMSGVFVIGSPPGVCPR